MQLTLRIKLLLAFVAMLVLVLAVGGVGVIELGRVNARNAATYADDQVGTGQVATLSQELLQMRVVVLAHILATDAARKSAIETDIAGLDKTIATTVEDVRLGDTDGEQRDELAQFAQAWDGYKRVRDGVTIPASRAGNRTDALGSYGGEEGARFDATSRTVDALIVSKAAAAGANHTTNIANYENARRLIIGATAFAILIGIALVLALRRTIAHVSQELRLGSQDLAASSTEILAASAQQAAGSAEQSAAIAETTAAVEQVHASAEQAVALASAVTETAGRANRVAEEGVAAVAAATGVMGEIRERVQSIAENILVLAEQGQQIGEIIATVRDLADQSNLLALNAAIEASRAGEHGKGFTVVAQEIRTLAEGSKAATGQVRTILSDIQRATNAAVLATEQGTKGVDAGMRAIGAVGGTIGELAEAIRQAAGSAAQITASVRQHAVGMEQIAVAMADINGATAQNLAAVGDTRQAAENLTTLARGLTGLVVRYEL